MRIVFCIYDFVTANLPLQPWLTVQMVTEGLSRCGHDVHIVTDVAVPAQLADVQLHSVESLRGSNATQVKAMLRAIRPDALVCLPTPLNIISASWLDGLDCRRVAFASYAFYNAAELLTAFRCVGWADVKQYLRHLLAPTPVWKRAVRCRLDSLIAQSQSTRSRLDQLLGGNPESIFVSPGIDLEQWPYKPPGGDADSEVPHLLYLGAAVPIRGFECALDAMTMVEDQRVRLLVLARGADSAKLSAIHAAIARRGIEGRVDVRGGWIDRATLISEIHGAGVVLQPFVLVPSELPVTAMEVIACGTPVIGSAIDGLPSTIGPAGTIVAQGSAAALANAISQYAQSADVRAAWLAGCVEQRNAMPDWETVTQRWETVLFD